MFWFLKERGSREAYPLDSLMSLKTLQKTEVAQTLEPQGFRDLGGCSFPEVGLQFSRSKVFLIVKHFEGLGFLLDGKFDSLLAFTICFFFPVVNDSDFLIMV